jgi:predicted polyphosphate/ATP-dependent NAD kinase
MKLGIIINPIAGMGGRVGLKGTDGHDVLKKALTLGAKPLAQVRTREALKTLFPLREHLEILTCPSPMGEQTVKDSGFKPSILPLSLGEKTSAEDTVQAARMMQAKKVDLLLFTGGDGTARDIYQAVGHTLLVLGIPAGVKIHSAVYAATPAKAGELAKLFLEGKLIEIRDIEVMDINEDDYRKGRLSARLFGYLSIPFKKNYVQNQKTGSSPSEKYSQEAIAEEIVENMSNEFYYIIGPGTTTRSIMEKLALTYTLLGADLVYEKKLIAMDLNETELLEKTAGRKTKILVTPIGGQGFIFGRGNQQISPEIITRVGKRNILVASTKTKLHSLRGHPLLVDTGDRFVDSLLQGYIKVITGYRESVIYPVSS